MALDTARSAAAATAAPARNVPATTPSVEADAELALAGLVAGLRLEDKVALLVGAGLWTTTALPGIGLRQVALSDGPAGVRGLGEDPAETSASFPAPSALAATWDVELAERVGAAFAAEARRHGVDVVLGPQVNLQRTPVGGRHFECYSEDPHLTAELAVHVVASTQERGVAMCPKHFVANDSETERTSYLARVDERTLREVYLAPFERLVREAGAWSVMGAYSGVDTGGTAAPALEHRPLLTGVLKEEWGFDGVVVSDWVATRTVGAAVDGGLDLQMPGPDGPWGEGLLAAVRSGVVGEAELDDKVLRVLRLARRVGALDGLPPEGVRGGEVADVDVPAVLRELAARSMVVLRDTPGALPVPGPVGRIALIGPNAVDPFVQGGGSAYVRPDRQESPADALAAAFPGAEVSVEAGAVARAIPPQLDVLGECTAPDGSAGLLVEVLDAQGGVLHADVVTSWPGWLDDPDPAAAAVRLRATVRLVEPGRHELGLGTVGRHRATVGGREVSRSDALVGVEVILDSSVNHPVPVVAPVEVTGPTSVDLDVTVQAVHPVGYTSFARAELVHRTPRRSSEELLAAAVEAARAADLVVLVVGTNEEVESEGYDRTSLALPGTQDALVEAVLTANPRTVVVVNAGAPTLLPWLDRAPTVLWGWLGGQEWSAALADVLAGRTEPAGRLPWTLPASEADVPVPDAVPVAGVVEYAEGTHVGYRSWLLLGRTPAAPFGHGLGWTTWEYPDAQPARLQPDGSLLVPVTVRNTGPRAGREVVQVYVEPPAGSDSARPVRWLGGFAVVPAGPGLAATAVVRVPARSFQVWDTATRSWRTPAGTYRLRIGRSSADLRLVQDVPIPEEVR